MKTLLDTFIPSEHGKVPAKEVNEGIHEILRLLGVSGRVLAHGLGIAEAQLHRMMTKKTGFYRPQTLTPFYRVAKLVEEARQSLSERGVKSWLNRPNPYLNNLPPILCVRSDQELSKVVAQLAAIRYGFPA